MRVNSIRLALFSFLVALGVAAFGSSGVHAADNGKTLSNASDALPPICLAVPPGPVATNVDGIKPRCNTGPVTIQHGDWHPCATDPNACGSGHSCCSGHCVSGSCS
jgi:hypothetical protein